MAKCSSGLTNTAVTDLRRFQEEFGFNPGGGPRIATEGFVIRSLTRSIHQNRLRLGSPSFQPIRHI